MPQDGSRNGERWLAPPPRAALRTPADSWPLDWATVSSYLAGQGLPLDPGFQPRQFAGGLANLNFLLRIEGRWIVLRRPPPGDLPPGANDMKREHRILSRLFRALPFVPESLHLCEDKAIVGAPFQLLEYREGVVVRGASLDPLAERPNVAPALATMLVETLGAIHAVDTDAIGLGTLGRPEGFVLRTAEGWITRAELVAGGQMCTAAAEVARWLRRHCDGVSGETVLLHNDFKLDNIIIDGDSLKPVAVLDWDMGTRGDAMFDLATLLSYWTEADDPPCMHRLSQMPTALPGFPTREEMVAAYAARTGRSLATFRPNRVLAMFKLAVVFHQLHDRFGRGERPDPRYHGFDRLAEDLFAFTLDIANDKTF